MMITTKLAGGETKSFDNIANFNGSVLDAEAMEISAVGVLSGFKISDVPSVLKLMITKCHKGGVLSIVERDMQRAATILKDGDFNDVDTLNKSITKNEKFNCFLTISYVEALVQQLKIQDVRVTGREICSSNQFILTLRREN
tara:strand:+ start:25111 stop:25536 length:426 start_codon:yes stop_codon:yes gene_type:complete